MLFLAETFVPLTIPIILVYAFLFFGLTGTELYFAFTEKEKERKIVKPFCVLALVLIALLSFPSEYFFWLALLCGVIGDIFFIFKDNQKCVYLGMFFFLINHLFFIYEAYHLMAPDVVPLHFYIISGVYALFLITGFFVIRKLLKVGVPMALAGIVYATFLALDFGMQVFGVCLGYTYLWFGVAGGFLFMLSDSFLSYTLFLKDVKRKDFYIMLTYLLAQALISVGYILQLINVSTVQ